MPWWWGVVQQYLSEGVALYLCGTVFGVAVFIGIDQLGDRANRSIGRTPEEIELQTERVLEKFRRRGLLLLASVEATCVLLAIIGLTVAANWSWANVLLALVILVCIPPILVVFPLSIIYLYYRWKLGAARRHQ
jgi:hypothetical protein